MNSALHHLPLKQAHPSLVRPLWLHSVGWFIACVASVTLAVVSMPMARWAGGLARPAAVLQLPPIAGLHRAPAAHQAADLSTRSTIRCQSCGVVEAVRALHTVYAAPAAYELTVRFRDGSRQISSYSGSARWSVGDSIILIGGAKLANRT